MTGPETDPIEDMFAEARRAPPQVPPALMARVLADAQALQPRAAAAGWRGFWRALGGAPGLGGLITATVVGFWIGAAPPDALPDLAGQIVGVQNAAPALEEDGVPELTAFGWDIEEG